MIYLLGRRLVYTAALADIADIRKDWKAINLFDRFGEQNTAQKVKFSIKNFFSKCLKSRSFLQFHIYWKNP